MSEPNSTPSLFSEALRAELRDIVQEAVRGVITQNGYHDRDRLISAREAAERWGVPKSWIESMGRSGKLPCVQLGVYKRFSLTDLERFIRENRKRPSPS